MENKIVIYCLEFLVLLLCMLHSNLFHGGHLENILRFLAKEM